jgi:hypothetical protein
VTRQRNPLVRNSENTRRIKAASPDGVPPERTTSAEKPMNGELFPAVDLGVAPPDTVALEPSSPIKLSSGRKRYQRKGGWGGKRAGAGRKPLLRPDGSRVRPLRPQSLSRANGASVLPALHRLVDDARVDLGHRLRRVEKAGTDNSKRLEAMQETLQRVLKHQTAIARHLGAIEPTTLPRHTRRRPLG